MQERAFFDFAWVIHTYRVGRVFCGVWILRVEAQLQVSKRQRALLIEGSAKLLLCWLFVRKDYMKTKARFLVVAAFCLACMASLVGCSGSNEQADAQTQNRQYMSSVNTIMETLNSNMDTFAEAVKDGEVVSLSAQLSSVDQCVSDLEGLSVPDAMGDIQSSYVNGAKELQTALSSYVQLYEDVKAPASGVAPSTADYNSRLADIQSHYDAGIKALQDADSKAESA